MADECNIFERDVWCLFGLPFDAITMNETVEKLHLAIENDSPCFISTPNLNFLIESQTDLDFRESVINSNMSLMDGKPLVWLSKVLCIPIPERVAGSDLIEELIADKNKKGSLKVFFFGGQEDASKKACENLNKIDSGLICVGNLNPGFGSIDNMSTKEIIDEINLSKADFIIVSLGAKKGQAWIMNNRKYLNAQAISHLGAVVNFIAGTVNRAPKILQELGLEWLWRIKEEPLLWKRYFNDGLSLINLLITRVLPLFFIIKLNKNKITSLKSVSMINVSTNNDATNIELRGYWGAENINEINKEFGCIVNSIKNNLVTINFHESSFIDSAVLAKIILFKNKLNENKAILKITTRSNLIGKIFKYSCCDYLL